MELNINPDILQEGSYDEYYEELVGMDSVVDIAIMESKEAAEDILNGESDMELVDIVSAGDKVKDDLDEED